MSEQDTKCASDQMWVSVGNVNDIPLRGSRRIVLDEKRIALFRTGSNKVYALRDQCPHEAGPLSEGIVHGNCVTCPLHNWVISLESGEAQGADHGSTQTYPVRTEGDQLLLNTDEHGSATAADDMPQKEPSTAVS